ncbi:VanZ family protein [Clostridium paraputrificum]|uniref:VanZ family protein n=1 Tax=Clostridium TaxID=1485 RepID=UPI003D33D0F6
MWKKVGVIILLLFAMGFIFYNSSKTGYDSNKVSSGILNKAESKVPIKKEVKSGIKDKLNITISEEVIIRKLAHMFEFFLLAILVALTLIAFGMNGKSAIIYVLFIVLMYAVLDEFHQIYVPGRTSSVRDVLIDFTGGFLGTICFYCIYLILPRLRRSTNNKSC